MILKRHTIRSTHISLYNIETSHYPFHTHTRMDIHGHTHEIKVNSLQHVHDGWHTIDELYEHRCLLFLNLSLAYHLNGNTIYYKLDNNTIGWFIVYIESPHGQISYHIPMKFVGIVKTFAVHDPDHIWDKHTSIDVLARLEKLLHDSIETQKKTFTIEEIRNYIVNQDSLGDIAYNLSERAIIKANSSEEVISDEIDMEDR